MKRIFILLTFFVMCWSANAQQGALTLSGGYVFGNSADTDNSLGGYRINALYEYNPTLGKFSHGFSFGYLHATSEDDGGTITEKITSWPIYYAPKYRFTTGKVKPFLKGALGVQFSSLKREGPAIELKANDTGFYAGAGAGVEVDLKDNIFLAVEYEWAYCSNSYYNDGFVNSAMGGIGFRF